MSKNLTLSRFATAATVAVFTFCSTYVFAREMAQKDGGRYKYCAKQDGIDHKYCLADTVGQACWVDYDHLGKTKKGECHDPTTTPFTDDCGCDPI